MDTLVALFQGFSVAVTPMNLVWAFVGVALGTFVGVLPGIGPALTVAFLLPATYTLEPTTAFILFAGLYYGGMYGGSTPAILLKPTGGRPRIITPKHAKDRTHRGRDRQRLAVAG